METLVTQKVSIVLCPRKGKGRLRPGTINMEVKERILTKAADLFSRYGIRSITMDEIASQLGISKKTIYQFFTDKDDMVSAVIDQEIARNEMDCNLFRQEAADAVQQVFLALESLDEMLKYTNPLMLYDLEKHHPRAFQKLREYKYRFLYQILMDNIQWGMDTEVYRNDLQKDIVAKWRIESAFLVFNPDVFPHSRYKISEVNYELAMLFLHGVVTPKGKKLIEIYTAERTQKLSHEQKV
jgi:TetR/AcrR family transcriptional regulator, cholesterol catabolism regulator